MKKLLFTAILSCLLLPCFSNWLYYETAAATRFWWNDTLYINKWYCVYCWNENNLEITEWNTTISNYGSFTLYCFNENWSIKNLWNTINVRVFNLNDYITNSCICNNYTSLECQTEYNLIPIESVTASYCKLNYDLIEPTECPINTGTGDISRTPRFINNSQYPWTALLRITIPDYIWFSVTYNTGESYLEIEWLNADTNYIENVINNEKLTPTNEDFEKLIWWLATFIPYLFIALLIIRMVKLFNKIWK